MRLTIILYIFGTFMFGCTPPSFDSSVSSEVVPEPSVDPTYNPRAIPESVVNIGSSTGGDLGNEVTAQQCQASGKQLIGPNLIFLIDNSSSNYGPTIGSTVFTPTDCPNRTPINVGANVYTCPGETVRKQAVVQVSDSLKEISSSDEASKSFISIIQYSSSVVTHLQNYQTNAVYSSAKVATAMEFTKTPAGGTSYYAAFKASSNIPDVGSVTRPRVIINITDGFPSDPPQLVFDIVAPMRKAGVKVITIIYTSGASLEELGKQWEATMTYLPTQDRDWVLGRGRFSLIQDTSDFIFLVKNPSEVPNLVQYVVNRVALSCK